MSYPILTDIKRVQVLMKSSTGLDEDTCVNNWYFRNDGGGSTPADGFVSMSAMLNEFYGGTDGGAPDTIASFIAAEINSVEYVMYDLGLPAPRYPAARGMATWTGGAVDRLPRETSCVLSFYSGQGPRARGRVYIGPLGRAASAVEGAFLKVSADLRNALTAQAENMRQSSQDATWVTVSPTAASSGVVLGGFVDNAWDTQRSRGLNATTRDTWGQPKS